MAKLTKNIRALLTNKSGKQKATIKGQEIATLISLNRKNRSKFDIDIVEINPIEGGVEVYARVFKKNGKQIGFGVDGSVDIERFKFFNPPILVDDPEGDIEVVDTEINGKGQTITTKRTLREAPEEALMQALEHTISVMKNVHGDKNIIPEKRGRTTATFYASAGDGHLRYYGAGSIGSCRSKSSGDGENSGTSTSVTEGVAQRGNTADYVKRLFLPFDTSSLDDSATISAATLSTFTHAGFGTTFYVCPSTQASISTLSNSDFGQVTLDSSPLYSSLVNTAGITDEAYLDTALNSTGIAAISKTGATKLVLRTNEDVNNIDGNAETVYGCYLSENTGTTKDPKLVVEYSTSVDVTATPSVLAATFSAQTRTVTGTANVTPAVQSAVFSAPARTVSGGATTSPSVLSAAFSIPTINVITPDAQILASVLTATFSVPTMTVSAGALTTPSVLSATFSQPAATFRGDFTALPSALSATFSVPAPTVTAIGNVTVTPSVLATTFSIPSPTVTAEQNAAVAVGVLSATFSTQAVTVEAIQNVQLTATTLVATFSIQTPRKVGGLWTAQPRVNGDAAWTPQPRAI